MQAAANIESAFKGKAFRVVCMSHPKQVRLVCYAHFFEEGRGASTAKFFFPQSWARRWKFAKYR